MSYYLNRKKIRTQLKIWAHRTPKGKDGKSRGINVRIDYKNPIKLSQFFILKKYGINTTFSIITSIIGRKTCHRYKDISFYYGDMIGYACKHSTKKIGPQPCPYARKKSCYYYDFNNLPQIRKGPMKFTYETANIPNSIYARDESIGFSFNTFSTIVNDSKFILPVPVETCIDGKLGDNPFRELY